MKLNNIEKEKKEDGSASSLLLIEDEAHFIEQLETLLFKKDRSAFNILQARTISDALSILEVKNVDAILIDISSIDEQTSETEEAVFPSSIGIGPSTEKQRTASSPAMNGIISLGRLMSNASIIPIISFMRTEEEELTINEIYFGSVPSHLDIKGIDSLYDVILHLVDDKKRREEVMECEGRYRSLLDDFGDAICVTNRDDYIVDANSAAISLFGYPEGELKGLNIMNLYAFPRDRVKINELSFQQGEVRGHEVTLAKKDGSSLNCQLSSSAVYDENGDLTGHRDVIRDMTAQTSAVEALNIMERAVESSIDAICVIEESGKISYANASFMKLWGYTSSIEILGMPIMAICKLDNAGTKALALATVEKGWQGESEITKNDGTVLTTLLTVSRVDEKGEFGAAMVSFVDMSELKALEEAFLQSKDDFQAIVSKCADALMIIDDEGVVRFANPASLEIFDREEDELLGESLGFLAVKGKTADIDIIQKNGEMRVAEVRAVKTRWKKQEAFLASFRDVTERKWLEEELKKQASNLEEEAQRRTREFLEQGGMASMSPIITGVVNTVVEPLSYIRSNTEILLDSLEGVESYCDEEGADITLPEYVTAMMKTNMDGILKMEEIIKTLARFSGEESGKRTKADPNRGIEDTLLLLDDLLRNKVQVRKSLADLPEVECNIGQLNQVFLNILVNATQAMDKGRIGVRSWHTDEDIYVEVMDNGEGIPDENMDKIFQPFFTTRKNAVGLGLSTSRNIITEHGGEITVDSEEGKGTTIQIRLPIV